MAFVKKSVWWVIAALAVGVLLVRTGHGAWLLILFPAGAVFFVFRYFRSLDEKAFIAAQRSIVADQPTLSMPSYRAIKDPARSAWADRLWYERARESLKQALLPTQMATVGLIVAFLLVAVSPWDAHPFLHAIHVSIEMWVTFWLFEWGIQAYQESALQQRYRGMRQTVPTFSRP